MQTINQNQAIHVIGIELRTTNQEAFETIPPHWQKFMGSGGLAQVPGRLSDDVYAVYTHFENAGRDNQGLYSLVLGASVPAQAVVPQGLVRVVIPASRRAVFAVQHNRPDLVGATWQEIWARSGLAKTFIAEYERYGADGRIEVLVGITPDSPPA